MPGIREFDKYIRTKLKRSLRSAYSDFLILSEADLQSLVSAETTKYLRRFPNKKLYQVTNKLYCKDVRIHPDLTVLKRWKPWICFELKEKGNISKASIEKDWDRLEKTRQQLHAKRGYLIYLSKRGDERAFKKTLPHRHRCLVPILICAEETMDVEQWKKWIRKMKTYSRYTRL